MPLKDTLQQHLIDALDTVLPDHPLSSATDIQLSPPKNPAFGDLSTNLPLTLSKWAKKAPLDIAEALANNLQLSKEIVDEITVTKPGFINFKIAVTYYYTLLSSILKEKDRFGCSNTGIGKNANVEFVSANPTGPLTVGHGRQAVLGDTVASILEWHGYSVTREYYYNDAGRQMRLLAQSVEARYFQLLDQDIALPGDGYEGEYIRDIARIVRERHGDHCSSGDQVFGTIAEEIIFSDIKQSLARLGIVHDKFSNEKTFYKTGAIEALLKELETQELIYQAEGATWFKTTALGKDKDRVLIKSSGEPTYRLPDMAYHRDKYQRDYDIIVDLFGADHVDTYPDVLSVMEILGFDLERFRVLIHQFVTLVRSGQKVKMSTRKANFVTLEELTERVGKDVVRYFFIMRSMNSHLNFDLDLAEDQSETNPVFYLQYAHARISNILKHGAGLGYAYEEDYDPSHLVHDSELTLLKYLDQFPDMMDSALDQLEPQLIANYLHDLAGHFHKFYTDCRVITDDRPLSQARLALIMAVRVVLANGLHILGINAPQRM